MGFRSAVVWITATLGLAAPILGQPQIEAGLTYYRGIYFGRSPQPTFVPASQTWRRAQEYARAFDDAWVVSGNGSSMQPLYAEGTVLVVAVRSYDRLESGMTAIYRNSRNRLVAHVLMAKARDGWRAGGLNNRSFDPEPVLAGNLVGVVVAAFAPAGIGS
ncbi:MAG: hypothetical protein A3G75_08840 [Verrucomicrobia bacterium RIFCSPLOWO2_12_FULL_64_8]|nr:MAG: hypothetical protein A3G75_08840 [Verrucomicrobia bacterium RIFCSPLOWO2_12_FULL_64_8]